MQTARTDRILQVSIGVLLAAFVYVIFISLYEHIVVVGDTAPDFSITADNGQTDEFRRQTAGAELLGDLVSDVYRGVALARSVSEAVRKFRSCGSRREYGQR